VVKLGKTLQLNTNVFKSPIDTLLGNFILQNKGVPVSNDLIGDSWIFQSIVVSPVCGFKDMRVLS